MVNIGITVHYRAALQRSVNLFRYPISKKSDQAHEFSYTGTVVEGALYPWSDEDDGFVEIVRYEAPVI